MGSVTVFDRLFDDASPLIRQGLHQRDSPSVEGGRWGVSVVLRPDPASAVNLERAMAEVEGLVGVGHFRTGTAGSVHFTVRVLEAYRDAAGKEDEVVQRYARAMSRAAARQVGAIELELVGITLAPGSVMVCAHPVDDNADRFMDLLKDELGDDAWREAEFTRDIWYANLLHFAADIAAPSELIEWVAQHRRLDLGRVVMDTAELVRFRYEDGVRGRLMRPEVLASVRIGSSVPIG
jgi:hypothetical protein